MSEENKITPSVEASGAMEPKTVDEAIAKAEADMTAEEKGIFKHLKGMFGNMRHTGRAGIQIVNAVKAMTRATSYSQEARRLCIAIDSKNRKPEDFTLAAKAVQRGVDVLAEVIRDFPTTANSVGPLRDKLIAQREEIKKVAKEEFGIEV